MGQIKRYVRKRSYDNKAVVPDRYMAFLEGDVKVEDLTDEEVFQMRLRSKDGSFKGRPPKAIPRELAMALQREQQRRIQAMLENEVPTAIETMHKLMIRQNPLPGEGVRFNAAKYILDKVSGVAPQKIEVEVNEPAWERVARDILVDVDTVDVGELKAIKEKEDDQR